MIRATLATVAALALAGCASAPADPLLAELSRQCESGDRGACVQLRQLEMQGVIIFDQWPGGPNY